MQIIIKTKDVALNEIIGGSIHKKIGGLSKFMKGFENHSLPMTEGRQLFETFVEIKKENNHHNKGNIFCAEVKMYLPGKNLFAKATGDEIMKAVLEVREELESEIRKYKAKVMEFPRRKIKQSNNR